MKLENDRILVVPNHKDGDSDVEFDDDDMTDGEDAMAEIEDANGAMDLYE